MTQRTQHQAPGSTVFMTGDTPTLTLAPPIADVRHTTTPDAPSPSSESVTGVTGVTQKRTGPASYVTDATESFNPARDGAALFDDIQAFYEDYVAYPDTDYPPVHALWTGHTWIVRNLLSNARLAFLSPEKRSGKTRAQEVTALFCPHPIRTIDVSAAYLFRKLDVGDGERLPTIFLDETDTLFTPGRLSQSAEDMRRIIDSGYRKGAIVGRCQLVNGKRPAATDYPVYAPVCLAGIGSLPDTIEDRSIIFRMKRRLPGVTLRPFRERSVAAAAAPIQERLEQWADWADPIVADYVDEDYPIMPPSIQDRDADVWEPLFIVAQLLGGHWPGTISETARRMVANQHADPQSLGERLLMDIRNIFDNQSANSMYRPALIDALKKTEGSPWGGIGRDGRAIDSHYLTNVLKRYDIRSCHSIKINGKTNWGYYRSDFEDAWARYLPPATPSSASGNAGNAGNVFPQSSGRP